MLCNFWLYNTISVAFSVPICSIETLSMKWPISYKLCRCDLLKFLLKELNSFLYPSQGPNSVLLLKLTQITPFPRLKCASLKLSPPPPTGWQACCFQNEIGSYSDHQFNWAPFWLPWQGYSLYYQASYQHCSCCGEMHWVSDSGSGWEIRT